MEVRAILHKLSGGRKRKRQNMHNPLEAYVRAMILPHFHAQTTPEIPFDVVQPGVYNVEGNPPHKLLEVHQDSYSFI